MKVTVLGAGAWGTALAKILAESGHQTTLWGRDAAKLEAIKNSRQNERLLPGVTLPETLRFTPDLNIARDAEVIVVSIPSQGLAGVVAQIPDYHGIMVSTTKGVDFDSGLTMSGIISKHCPSAKVAALSGPTIAIVVAKHSPSAIVAASSDATVAGMVQKLFSTPTFRVYSSTDLYGVELGGAFKNVFAIAAGAGDGLGFGDNAKAALITRSIEGYPASRSVRKLAQEAGIESPIIDEVHLALYEGKDVRLAVRDLMTRELKAED